MGHPTAAQLAQHVSDLCKAFDVKLIVGGQVIDRRTRQLRPLRPDEGAAGLLAGSNQKLIRIYPVIDESTYAVALHELGHCCDPVGMLATEGSQTLRRTNQMGTIRDVKLRLESERAAWVWARHYALIWTPLMQTVEDFSLRSYIAMAQRYLGRVP